MIFEMKYLSHMKIKIPIILGYPNDFFLIAKSQDAISNSRHVSYLLYRIDYRKMQNLIRIKIVLVISDGIGTPCKIMTRISYRISLNANLMPVFKCFRIS